MLINRYQRSLIVLLMDDRRRRLAAEGGWGATHAPAKPPPLIAPVIMWRQQRAHFWRKFRFPETTSCRINGLLRPKEQLGGSELWAHSAGMTNPHSPGMMYPFFITSGKQKHFGSFNKSSEPRQFGEYTSVRGEASVFYVSLSGELKKARPAYVYWNDEGRGRGAWITQGLRTPGEIRLLDELLSGTQGRISAGRLVDLHQRQQRPAGEHVDAAVTL